MASQKTKLYNKILKKNIFFFNFSTIKKNGGHLGFLWFVRKAPKLELNFIQIRDLQPLRILKLSSPLSFPFVQIRNIHCPLVFDENQCYLVAILVFDQEDKPSPWFLHNLRKISSWYLINIFQSSKKRNILFPPLWLFLVNLWVFEFLP